MNIPNYYVTNKGSIMAPGSILCQPGSVFPAANVPANVLAYYVECGQLCTCPEEAKRIRGKADVRPLVTFEAGTDEPIPQVARSAPSPEDSGIRHALRSRREEVEQLAQTVKSKPEPKWSEPAPAAPLRKAPYSEADLISEEEARA